MQAVTSLDVRGLEAFSKGKVRNLYDLGDKLLIVASDRISAFDYVLPSGIPDKGKILTTLSAFWFKKLESICDHHMITDRVEEFPADVAAYRDLLRHRSMLVWKARRIDIECIVRGYIAGSAWKEYSETGRVAGTELPSGLKQNAKIERPLFTPSTKADDGHDRNITMEEMRDLVGAKPTEHIVAKSVRLYSEARKYAEKKGITLLDTKFEFGYLKDDIILIDEVFTPDSSRFTIREGHGSEVVHLDKQYIRDFLETTEWDKNSPPPALPEHIVTECRRRYLVLLERLTGMMPEWAK